MNKNTKRLYAKLIILIIGIIIILRIVFLVFAKYSSEATFQSNINVAFYLFKEDYQSMSLNLASIFPQKDAYVFTFTIGNQDKDKSAEIDLKYNLTLKATTNLPIKYELYMNQNYNDANAKNIITSDTTEKDDDGTYFKTMTVDTETLEFANPKTNVYNLVINFPENYNTENFQDIIEMIEIEVESKQWTE